MKLHNQVQDQAVVSNVGQIGEFRIRNSAKAFSILSSGLYANKIRAIIRELSCNAIDSHVAAGKPDTPFDVHLPNALEPHFSIRDYGTGLTHDQVTSIYTTYFESTKTNSNEFIGALGLGSKSPFSYTDNFTVTAIKDGRKGIYTAFINDQGVPSIALMMEEETTDPSGVEVKFSVNDRYDFDKFQGEARAVYQWFKQRPVVSGQSTFKFIDLDYETKDIVPGVHSLKESNRGVSYAVMGNIAYPIQIPQADKTLGGLTRLLSYGNLVIEFGIGELDFQASREGLSYIPETIQAIKAKLEVVNGQLANVIAKEANKITGVWEKSMFLATKSESSLWKTAVDKYIADTKFEYCSNPYSRSSPHNFDVKVEDLAKKFNIVLRRFSKHSHYETCSNSEAHSKYDNDNQIYKVWTIHLSKHTRFVVNDTKIGCSERAKYHVKNSTYLKDQGINQIDVLVIDAVDKKKSVNLAGFKKLLANPPEGYFMKASKLMIKERADGIGKNVTIMNLVDSGRQRWGRTYDEMVWRDAGKADSFDKAKTYYYIPLSGFQSLGKCSDVKFLHKMLSVSGLFNERIYGVRKGDIEFIKTQKNWIELDTLILGKLAKFDKDNIMGLVKQALDVGELIKYNSAHIKNTSPFVTLANTFEHVKGVDSKVQNATEWLCKQYDVKNNTSPQALIDKYKQDVIEVKNRYPLLKNLSYGVDKAAIAEYINLIDQSKGV